MKRSTRSSSGGKPEMSKYARKQAELATGIREPFDFREERQRKEEPKRIAQPASTKPMLAAPVSQLSGTISGKLVLLAAAKGYFFIETDEGAWVHVGLSLLRPTFEGHRLSKSTVVTCETEHRPGARNPRATVVHSVAG